MGPFSHRALALGPWRVPPPFRSFAVRSEEPQHAWQARAPYGYVHALRTPFLCAADRAALQAQGAGRVKVAAALDVDYATTSWPALAAAAPGVVDLPGQISAALQATGVLGPDVAVYRAEVERRIDHLACRGAGFHNDVARRWSRSLFWLLALQAADVAFVMPHAGFSHAVQPGDLLLFDPAIAHGLCRPADGSQARAASFEHGPHRQQWFLTGELLLNDAQWAALGAPWLSVQAHAERGALDLLVATFDDTSGAIQRLRALRDGFSRSVCHADADADVDAGAGA